MSKPSAAKPDSDESAGWLTILMGATAAVFCSRFYLPAESAAQGATLWIVGLWLVCAWIWQFGILRGWTAAIRFDRFDAAIAVWIGTQVVAVIAVFFTGGEKRLAVDMGWEWVGAAIVWLIIRHGFLDPAARHALIMATIVSGVVLSGLGLYQHYISQPRVVAEYGPLFDRLRSASGADAALIKQRLAQAGIPTEDPALTLFEKRLRDSREPIALFALANTLGGCLAVCLLLTIGQILSARARHLGLQQTLPLVVFAAVIAWCLLLTKSRTAWIGTACGLVVLVGQRARLGLPFRLRTGNFSGLRIGSRLQIGLMVLFIVLVPSLLFLMGGLDKQVLSEAPKSLSYRFQYWQATSRLVADHFWWGVGPGNFRQHYLKYKLPEASEEIADPHNLFFDVAATGGVLSVIGLTLFLGLVTVSAIQRRSDVTAVCADAANPRKNSHTAAMSRISSQRVFWIAGFACPLAFLGTLCFDGDWDDRLLILTIGWFVVAAWVYLVEKSVSVCHEEASENDSRSAFVALVALAVHLTGAGGIAMPCVLQLLLALAALSLAGSSRIGQIRPIGGRMSGLILLTLLTLWLAGLVQTGIVPVVRSRWWIRGGDLAWSTRADGRNASLSCYQQAAMADPWSAEPWRLQFEVLSNEENQSNETSTAAVDRLRAYMVRDPVNFWGPRSLGKLMLSRWRRTHQAEDALQAMQWLRSASALYPTNSSILAELATSLAAAEQWKDARSTARASLDQDEIYRKQGHIDRYLPDEIRAELQQILNIESQKNGQ